MCDRDKSDGTGGMITVVWAFWSWKCSEMLKSGMNLRFWVEHLEFESLFAIAQYLIWGNSN